MTAIEVYEGLEPAEVWRHFAALNEIPRPSGSEAAACAYVQQVAASAGAAWSSDAAGNVVVRVPATSSELAAAPAVAIQSHLDMVCEKRPDVAHDFNTDPIRPRREGNLVFATGTTLGADNGMGAAMMLALLTTPNLQHGPLELLFTIEEETGLHGAMALDASQVSARMLVNLDSEDPAEITVGCAGGAGTILYVPVEKVDVPEGAVAYEITVSGLQGGHSGVQIHEPLANAIKLLTTALISLRDAGIDFSLSSISGGTAHNAIPRDATAFVTLAPHDLGQLQKQIAFQQDDLRLQWGEYEPALALLASEAGGTDAVLCRDDRDRILDLVHQLPHGVLKMSEAFAGKVETSSNLAGVQVHGDSVEIATSSRSFNMAALDDVQAQIAALGRAAGARIEVRDGYPGWEPDPHSRLLQETEAAYLEVNANEAEVQVIHAGLECGVIVSKLPGMEAVSFGPLIKGAHSPDENIDVTTVPPIWQLLLKLLERVGKNPEKA